MEGIQSKRECLMDILRSLGSVVVAYSGGVDSSYLLAASLEALGPQAVLAVTADSATYTPAEREEALALASRLGARHRFIETDELEDPSFTNNPPERCYFCKQHLFGDLWRIAREEGLAHVVYGANRDDLGDHRPGMRAASECGARAPLLEAGLAKAEVRELSRLAGLPTWDRPATACLASRFPYHSPISEQALGQVAAAEAFLRRELGLRQVRVRHHGETARLEVDREDLARLIAEPARGRVVARLKELGYSYIALDLEGYRSGSMNEVLAAGG